MTHYELLEELNEVIADFDLKYDNSNPYYKALRAVVELHKPKLIEGRVSNYSICLECRDDEFPADYPCQTIQAIEKELK